jgi:hypothetical protein
MSGSILLISTKGYPEYSKLAKTTRSPEAYMKNVNTYHPVLPKVELAVEVGDIHLAKRILKEHSKGVSKTSSDWSKSPPSKRIVKSVCKSIDNLNICNDCEYGGDNLLCCDNCPRSFHLPCIGLRLVPDGEWSCEMCHEPISPRMLKLSKEFETTDCTDTNWA